MSTYQMSRVSIQNVLKIVAFDWTSSGEPVVTLKGANGAGKSSVHKAILAALCGGREVPKEIMRVGARAWRAEVELVTKGEGETGDKIETLTVSRAGLKDGNGNLTISTQKGTRIPSPQALLDTIISKGCLDPERFLRLKERDQVRQLLAVCGQNYDLDQHDAKRAAVYEQRAAANRRATVAKAVAESAGPKDRLMELAKHPIPDASKLLVEIRKAEDYNRSIDQTRASVKARSEKIEQTEAEIKRLEAELVRAHESLNLLAAAKAQDEKNLETMVRRDTALLQKQVRDASKTAIEIANAKSALSKWETYEQAAAESGELTKQLEYMDALIPAIISQAEVPIPGVTVGGDLTLRYNGKPFSQASSAEQRRTAIHIEALRHPTFRVVFVDEGSGIDGRNLKAIENIAQELGLQVWINTVNEALPGILIEDGMRKDK